MGLFDLFRRQERTEEPEIDPLQDLVLGKMRVGFLVDYDLETWKVTAYNRYDFDEGDLAEEWELTSGRQKRYLERTEDDDVVWTLGRKVPLGAIERDVRKYIMEHDEAPQRLTWEETRFFLDGSAAGYLIPGGKGPRQELIKYEYVDESEERFLTIEQWSESDFEAAGGSYVEEFEFSNILPGEGS